MPTLRYIKGFADLTMLKERAILAKLLVLTTMEVIAKGVNLEP